MSTPSDDEQTKSAIQYLELSIRAAEEYITPTPSMVGVFSPVINPSPSPTVAATPSAADGNASDTSAPNTPAFSSLPASVLPPPIAPIGEAAATPAATPSATVITPVPVPIVRSPVERARVKSTILARAYAGLSTAHARLNQIDRSMECLDWLIQHHSAAAVAAGASVSLLLARLYVQKADLIVRRNAAAAANPSPTSPPSSGRAVLLQSLETARRAYEAAALVSPAPVAARDELAALIARIDQFKSTPPASSTVAASPTMRPTPIITTNASDVTVVHMPSKTPIASHRKPKVCTQPLAVR